MKTTIVYQSRHGKTAAYAREIAMYLWQKGISVSLCATSDFKPEKLENCDSLLLGCWTSGWFLFNQHPNPIWKTFAKEYMQVQLPKNLLLFTTYMFRTGSLFKRMKKHINLKEVESVQTLKSKTGFLSDKDKKVLDELVIKMKMNDSKSYN